MKMKKQNNRNGSNLPDADNNGRTNFVLAVIGILIGLGFVLVGLLEPPLTQAPETDIVATVNGRPISASRFQRLADGLNDELLASERPILKRMEILDRLIEEELLVSRAVELGLPYSDKIARGYLINSLLTLITAEAMTADPEPETLEWFFKKNPQWFTPARQVAAQFVFVAESSEAGRRKAEAIRRRWAGLPLGQMESEDPPPLKVPQSLVPVTKLADYLGSETADSIARLAVGETSPPAPWMGGWIVARCMDRTGGELPAFQDVESQVMETFRRRKAEDDYGRYMDNLRIMADIQIATDDK